MLTVTEFSWVTFGLWGLLWAVLIVRLLHPIWREALRLPLLIVAMLLVVAGFLLVMRLYITTYRPPAVIVESTAHVMSGPGDHYLEHFTLHSGAEIRILETRDDWVRFLLPDGRQGWLPESAFEQL